LNEPSVSVNEPAEHYQLQDLNANVLNQMQNFLNHETWLEAFAYLNNTGALSYVWSGSSTESMVLAESQCETSSPVISPTYGGAWTYFQNSVGPGPDPYLDPSHPHTYYANVYSAVGVLTAFLPATNYWTNLTFNADWYIQIETNWGMPYTFNDLGNSDVKNLPGNYTTAGLQTVQVNVTTVTCSVSFGSTTFPEPPQWPSIPFTDGASGVEGWSLSGAPLCLFRFNCAGGFKYY